VRRDKRQGLRAVVTASTPSPRSRHCALGRASANGREDKGWGEGGGQWRGSRADTGESCAAVGQTLLNTDPYAALRRAVLFLTF
jgi:hypothetical protein